MSFQPLRGPGSGLGQQACWEHGVCQCETYQGDGWRWPGSRAGRGREGQLTMPTRGRGRCRGERKRVPGPMAPFYHSRSVLATHKSLYLKTQTKSYCVCVRVYIHVHVEARNESWGLLVRSHTCKLCVCDRVSLRSPGHQGYLRSAKFSQ